MRTTDFGRDFYSSQAGQLRDNFRVDHTCVRGTKKLRKEERVRILSPFFLIYAIKLCTFCMVTQCRSVTSNQTTKVSAYEKTECAAVCRLVWTLNVPFLRLRKYQAQSEKRSATAVGTGVIKSQQLNNL